jgi:hypothetical protein
VNKVELKLSHHIGYLPIPAEVCRARMNVCMLHEVVFKSTPLCAHMHTNVT